MIQVSQKKKGDVVHIICEGILTHEDYKKVLIPKLEKAIKTSSPIRAFCDVRHFKGIEGRAMWDDFKFGLHHIKDVERIATVGDQWWISPIMKVTGPLFRKLQMKHFKSDQYKEALKWVDQKH